MFITKTLDCRNFSRLPCGFANGALGVERALWQTKHGLPPKGAKHGYVKIIGIQISLRKHYLGLERARWLTKHGLPPKDAKHLVQAWVRENNQN